ncbi:hypothetical protein F5050DRAFT_1569589 [Lentinula boryana]|uniref:SWIM-type domain-containing protein n=1 Tax=Lentinula boryana TaxID=40481 RepID=A0ABQ8QFT2_9AGAR|nr:hypothetical protein F5050DRAFT_1569589 [Lentinula boryana]
MVLQKRKADGTYELVTTKRFRRTPNLPLTSVATSFELSSSQPLKVSSKGGRKKAEPQEKRLARFRSFCPNDISARLDRYFTQAQRIYLIERNRENNALKEEFIVQGSTGNVYTVTIHNVPHCNCPDHQKGHHCKHLLFILLKVLQIPQSSNYWYQRALLTDELSDIFSAAPPPPQLRGSFIANQNVVGAWREATGRGPTLTHTKSSISDDSRRIPASGDDCPICYDKMNDEELDLSGLEKILEWCNSCHNPVHKECWNQWRTTKQRQDQSLTCVYCRSGWIGGVGGSSEEGFLNLARFSGVSTVRDTSTCLSFPCCSSKADCEK